MNKKAQLNYIILFSSIVLAGILIMSFAMWTLISESKKTEESIYEYISRQLAWRIDLVASSKENISTKYKIPKAECSIETGYGRVLVKSEQGRGALAYFSVNPIEVNMFDNGELVDEIECDSKVKINYNKTHISVKVI